MEDKSYIVHLYCYVDAPDTKTACSRIVSTLECNDEIDDVEITTIKEVQ